MKLLLLPFTADATSWYPWRPGWSPQNHPSPQSLLRSGRITGTDHTQSYRGGLYSANKDHQVSTVNYFAFTNGKFFLLHKQILCILVCALFRPIYGLLLRKIHCMKALYWVKTFSSLFNHGSQMVFRSLTFSFLHKANLRQNAQNKFGFAPCF